MSIPLFDANTRRFAHHLVDLLFDHVERVDERPVVDWAAADELRRLVSLDQEPRTDGPPLEQVTGISRYLYQRVNGIEELEAMHEPQLDIFCFRHRGGDALNGAIRERLIRGGMARITTTVLAGRRMRRVTMINPRTTRAHIGRLLDEVLRLGR
ncbi:MAG TPA: hypothetical protein VGR02_01045 [Thermoanaerobaculia bacterium]|jgi:hypothetical protein|nr:hypothetical protein [Thermoanaerobaculia bacterium]